MGRLDMDYYEIEKEVKNRIDKHTDNITEEINLDKESWKAIKKAAKESPWIPKEYFMGDWVSDVCSFLSKNYLRPGKPCSHSGCCSHVSHPCEVCGKTVCGLNL